MCWFIGHCWLIYPQLKIGSERKFSFSDVKMNVITCRWKDSSAFLPCKAKQVDSSPVCHYEVENLDITLIPGSVFKTLFPWEACKEILYFFDDYIY